MADCIKYMFDVVDAEEASTTDITIPDTPKIGNDYVGIKTLDPTVTDVAVTTGGFTGKDGALSGKSFKNNWMKQ